MCVRPSKQGWTIRGIFPCILYNTYLYCILYCILYYSTIVLYPQVTTKVTHREEMKVIVYYLRAVKHFQCAAFPRMSINPSVPYRIVEHMSGAQHHMTGSIQNCHCSPSHGTENRTFYYAERTHGWHRDKQQSAQISQPSSRMAFLMPVWVLVGASGCQSTGHSTTAGGADQRATGTVPTQSVRLRCWRVGHLCTLLYRVYASASFTSPNSTAVLQLYYSCMCEVR